MKALNLLVGDLYQLFSVKSCAAAMGVAEKTAYPYSQPRSKNGQTIPVENLLLLLAYSRDSQRADALSVNLDIASVFCEAAGVKAISAQVLRHLSIGIDAALNGGQLKASPPPCPDCGQPLKLTGWIDHQPVFTCTHCRVGTIKN